MFFSTTSKRMENHKLGKYVHRVTVTNETAHKGECSRFSGWLVRVPLPPPGDRKSQPEFRQRLLLDVDYDNDRQMSLRHAFTCVDCFLPLEETLPQTRAPQKTVSETAKPVAPVSSNGKHPPRHTSKTDRALVDAICAQAQKEKWGTSTVIETGIVRINPGRSWCYQARVYIQGRLHSKSFALAKYGVDEALKLAREALRGLQLKRDGKVALVESLARVGRVVYDSRLHSNTARRQRVAHNQDLPSHMRRGIYKGRDYFAVTCQIKGQRENEVFYYDEHGGEQGAKAKALEHRRVLLELKAEAQRRAIDVV
jgi:hypothetical protein